MSFALQMQAVLSRQKKKLCRMQQPGCETQSALWTASSRCMLHDLPKFKLCHPGVDCCDMIADELSALNAQKKMCRMQYLGCVTQ